MGEGCGPGLMVVGVAAFLAVVFWMSNNQTQARNHYLARISSKWNGRVVEGSFFDNARLEIESEGITGQVTYDTGGKNRSAWTKVHFNWSSPKRLRMHPEGFTSFFRSMFGGTDVEVGDPLFDGTFWLEASDAKWARDVLTPRIRRRLLGMRAVGTWFSSNDVTLDLGPAGLVLKISQNLVDEGSALEEFVDLAILILGEMKAAGAVAGVVVAEVEVKSGSECPVCGHAVEDAATRCSQCGTPHHQDCWKYMGGCSIYACGGRRAG